MVAGVTVTVRFAPLPPIAMFAFGTNVVFDELPLKFVFWLQAKPAWKDGNRVIVEERVAVWAYANYVASHVWSIVRLA